MKVIVIGCGKLGSHVARELEARGDTVVAVDTDQAAFRRLGADFRGRTVLGTGFDRAVLDQAGIDEVDAVVATTSSDEANGLIGLVGRDRFHVPRVIARLHDANQARLYRSLGVGTISTTAWGVDRICEMLSFEQLDTAMVIGDSDVELVRVEAPTLLVGRPVSVLLAIGEVQVVCVERDAHAFLPTRGTQVHAGDILWCMVMTTSKPRLKSMLGQE